MALDNYRILVENEISAWDDETGVRYHFPKNRYFNRLKTGMRFIYYKGRTKTTKPQYFGYGEIANIYPDLESQSDYYADITNYIAFETPLDFKPNGEYLEDVLISNHFRQNSVRPISEEKFYKILELAELNLKKTGNIEQPVVVTELPAIADVSISMASTSLIKQSVPKSKEQKDGSSQNFYNPLKSTKHGNQGELLVLKHLRATLSETEANTLRHHAKENEKDGYDISYTDLSDKKIYIEVKATSAPSFPSFIITINELLAAEKYGAAYQIYLLNKVTSKDVKIEVIDDIANLIRKQIFAKTAVAFKVERKNGLLNY
jgi:hypothetical protein